MKKQEYSHEYYIKNREKILAKVKKWQKENREKYNLYMRNYYYTHPEEMKTRSDRRTDRSIKKRINKRRVIAIVKMITRGICPSDTDVMFVMKEFSAVIKPLEWRLNYEKTNK